MRRAEPSASSGAPRPTHCGADFQLRLVSASPTFQITGTGLGQLLTATSEANDAANTGSASVSFGTQLVRTATFRSGAATTGNFDPIESGLALGNITYENVPEPAAGVLLLSAMSLASFRRRAK